MKLLRSLLRGLVADDELSKVSGGFDMVGDIAVVKLPSSWSHEMKARAGELLMQRIPRIKSVWNQVSPVKGEFRVRDLEYVAGERRTLTEYKESGVRLFVDVATAYFSPRLSSERLRVAGLVNEGEKIFNMFSGVGSFSLVIAKKISKVEILSSEINPQAYMLMVKNVESNKLRGKVMPLLGDCRNHISGREGMFDRVIMSLPNDARMYLPYAAAACKKGGVVHYYSTVRSDSRNFIEEEWSRVSGVNPCFKLQNARIVTESGPRSCEIVLDLLYKPA